MTKPELNRYLVFRIVSDGPAGGLGDIEDTFEDLDEALALAAEIDEEGDDSQVFDCDERAEVEK